MLEFAKAYIMMKIMQAQVKEGDVPRMAMILGNPELTQDEANHIFQSVLTFAFSLVKL